MIGSTYLNLITIIGLISTLSTVQSKDFYLGTRYGKRDEYEQAIKPIPLNQAFARFLDISIQIPERQREILLDRYSRSNLPVPIEVSPRNDRFFMGTRYGKRNNDIVHLGRESDDLRSIEFECQHKTNEQRIFECNGRHMEMTPIGSNTLRNEDSIISYGNDQILI
uniref:RYamide n=1 Tax=Diaphorina citri TaxID=121845 RepID=A0A2U9PFT1_DIACI|nr:RYamide [Diaphorina citri]